MPGPNRVVPPWRSDADGTFDSRYWPRSEPLPIGPDGPQGPEGPQGVPGPQGPKGDPGEGAAFKALADTNSVFLSVDEAGTLAAEVDPGLLNDLDVTKGKAAVAKERVLDLADYLDITGTSDGTSGLQAALNAAVTKNASALYLRAGASVTLSGTVDIPDALRQQVRIVGDGPMGARITQTVAAPLLRLDPNTTSTTATRRTYWRLENLYLVGPGKTVSGSVGLHLNNGLLGKLEHVIVDGFETGIHLDALDLANGAATYYNTLVQPVVLNCTTGIVFDHQANSNWVYGGRVGLCTLGVWVKDNTTNVGFFGGDIEGNGNATTPAVAIDGYATHLVGTRVENPSAQYEVWLNRFGGTSVLHGAKNVISPYFSSMSVAGRVRDDSVLKDNMVLVPGVLRVGDSGGVLETEVLKASRSVNANNKPFADFTDSYTASGTPIGVRYRSRRTAVPFLAEASTDGVTWNTVFKVQSQTSGNGQLVLGNTTGTKQTNIFQTHVAPEGVLVGNIGDIALCTSATVNVGGMYVKQTGDGTNTGWVKK